MSKRKSLNFSLKEEDHDTFRLISSELIKANFFRSQMEIMECFIQFLTQASPEELIKLKLAPTKKTEAPK